MEKMIVLDECKMKDIYYKMPKEYNMMIAMKIELSIQIHIFNLSIFIGEYRLPLIPV